MHFPLNLATNHCILKNRLYPTKVIALLLLLFFTTMFTTLAQPSPEEELHPTLTIGQKPPPLFIGQWLKGKAVKRFEKGRYYVIEFWATWCAPCRAAMPHLSEVATQYKDWATFIGVSVMEEKKTTLQKIRHFVDSMGNKMNYTVATEKNNGMFNHWYKAAGLERHGIPVCIVVNGNGLIAWIGYPNLLPTILPSMFNNSWNLKDAHKKRNEEIRLTLLDREVGLNLLRYTKSLNWAGSQDKPDSLLMAVAEHVKAEPLLAYAPMVASHTISALFKTDMHKAAEYIRLGLTSDFFGKQPCYVFMDAIESYEDSIPLTREIFSAGTQACQASIDHLVYPELVPVYKMYVLMASWYWRMDEPAKAIIAQKKAIASMKSRHEANQQLLQL